MNPYKEQYHKETEQIHAPAELIARTKAAMREEEARIRGEFAVQAAGPEMAETLVMPGERSRGMNARKWAYPLTVAAALLILVSVSMMMRGLKSEEMASGSPAYEEAAVETESAEMSGGEDWDGGMAEAGAAMESAESAASDTTAFSKGSGDVPVEKSEAVEQNEQQRKLNDARESLADDAASPAENETQSGVTEADTEKITIEKVIRRPDFCGQPDTETRVFEGETFQIAKEENGWAAYVETEDKDKYVIRGEAPDLETFLETGYRKLQEMK